MSIRAAAAQATAVCLEPREQRDKNHEKHSGEREGADSPIA